MTDVILRRDRLFEKDVAQCTHRERCGEPATWRTVQP